MKGRGRERRIRRGSGWKRRLKLQDSIGKGGESERAREVIE